MNNVYDGGDGFDILALQTFAPRTITGEILGAFARYTYLTGSTFSSNSTTTGDRNIRVKYQYEETGHVKATLDEDGNRTVEYWQDDASGRVQATGFRGTATYSVAEPTWWGDLWPAYTTKTAAFDYSFSARTLDKISGQGISFAKSGDNNNGTGRISTVPVAPEASKGGLYAAETFSNIEGLIGTAGDDRLVGNSRANALYGNGGWDLIAGGGDGNLLGFGEGQKIADIFSFPGSGGGGLAPGRYYPKLEETLAFYDPYGTISGDLSIPVGRIRTGFNTDTDKSQVVGSMLWGQGHDNTLDMRFDRGISFFPDRSTNYAVVDLNVAGANAPVNFHTGEQVMYGRAEWRAANGTLLTFATTFGVHNVIGSQNGDTIRGDRADNVIEGMDGGDFMDGEGGVDTLSYARAPSGVTLHMDGNGGDGLNVFNQGAGREGRGHAEGDRAYNFERFVLSDHDDIVLIDIPLASDVQFETFGNGARGLTVPIATPYANAPHFIDLGAGGDHLRLVGGPRVLADLGEGDDTADVAGPGHVLHGGAGDDSISIVDPGQVLPQGAAILGPGGGALAVGAVVAAADIAALRAVPGQGYGQAGEYFRFTRSDAPGAVEAMALPFSPPIPGISLGLVAPVDPLGAALAIRITELPGHGTVFYRGAVPELAELGLLVPVEVPVSLGDDLTPDQLEKLYFRPGQDATGAAGRFAYSVDHGQGLGGIPGMNVSFANGLSSGDYDGRTIHRTTIQITPVDDAPVVSRLLFPMSPGGVLEGSIAASDPEGQGFVLNLVEGPGRGTLTMLANGNFTYVQTAAINFAGAAFVEEVFTVQAVQSAGGLVSAARPQTIRIVNPDFHKPIVFDVTRPEIYFADDGTPIKLGGLGTNDRIIGAEGIDNELHGFGGHDPLRGVGGSNRLFGGAGNDWLFGDNLQPAYWMGEARAVYRLYQATLDRAPDAAGFKGWITSLGNGTPFLTAVAGFVNSTEFQNIYGALSDTDFVELLYQNVLGRAADAGGLAGWTGLLAGGTSRAQVVQGFSQSGEFITTTTPAVKAWIRAQGQDDVLEGGAGSNDLWGGVGGGCVPL